MLKQVRNWYESVILPSLLSKSMRRDGLEDIRKNVLSEANGVVLEIGSGPGFNFPLYTSATKLYALEPSQVLIDESKQFLNKVQFDVEFIKSGAEDIPLPDESVDTVVSTWTLCSVHNLDDSLREIKRVLKPNGEFLFVDHGASPNVLLRIIQSICTQVTKWFSGNCHYDRNIETSIQNAGFQISEISHPTEKFKPLIYNYRGVATKI